MASLTDIVPTGQRVSVGGMEVEVFGLTGRAIAHLLGRFPDLRKVLVGQAADLDKLISMGPECVAAVIACGMRKVGDEPTENAVLDLPFGDWAELLGPILKQTMPKGVAPFVSMLADLGLKASETPGAGPGTEPATKSPKR